MPKRDIYSREFKKLSARQGNNLGFRHAPKELNIPLGLLYSWQRRQETQTRKSSVFKWDLHYEKISIMRKEYNRLKVI